MMVALPMVSKPIMAEGPLRTRQRRLFPVIDPAVLPVRRGEASAIIVAIEELDVCHLARRSTEHDLPARALLIQMLLLRVFGERAEGDEVLQEVGRHRDGV